jgi:uridine kinase
MHPTLIGISGGTGSGKTTLAKRLAEHFGDSIALIRQDDYYRNRTDMPRVGDEVNYDHPDSFDMPLLLSHIAALRSGERVEAPIYEYKTHTRSEKTRLVSPAPVVLVEGILLFESEELSELFDMKIFVDTDPDVRLLRRIRRDIESRGRTLDSVIRQYLTTVKPMHEAFVEPSKKRADVIVPEGGENRVATDMIIDRIEHLITPKQG